MQEGARRNAHLYHLTVAGDIEPVKRLDWAFSLTLRGAKRGEIVLTQKPLRSLMHCLMIKALLHPPCPLIINGQGRTAIMNPVEIMSRPRRKPRVEAICRLLNIENADALIRHNQMRIDRIAHLARTPILGETDMRHLCHGVNARIGATSGT